MPGEDSAAGGAGALRVAPAPAPAAAVPALDAVAPAPRPRLWGSVLQSTAVGTANRLLSVAVRVVTLPLLLRYLGSERYGLWMTIATVSAYVSLFDFGAVSALTNKLTHLYQDGRTRRAHTFLWGTAAWLALVAAIGVAAGALLLARVDLGAALKLSSPTARAEALPALVVTLVAAGLQLALAPFQRAPYTMHLGAIAESYSLGGTMLSLVALVGAVAGGLTLPYLAAALVGGPVVASLGVALHLARTGRLQWAPLGARRMRAVGAVVARAGAGFVVMQAAAALLGALPVTLLATAYGAAAVAPYALLLQGMNVLQAPVAAMQQPLWARLAALDRAGRLSEVRAVIERGAAAAALYALVAGAALVLLSEPVLRALGANPPLLPLSLRLAFAGYCALGLVAGGLPGVALLALGLSRAVAALAAVQVAAFLLCQHLLVPRYGAVGMVASIAATYVIATPVQLRLLWARLARAPAPAGRTA